MAWSAASVPPPWRLVNFLVEQREAAEVYWGRESVKKILPRLFLFVLLAAAVPVHAVNRVVKIVAPAEAPAGSSVTVAVSASTDAADGEQIGFLHAEYSTDGGMTWAQFCNVEQAGAELTRSVSFPVGAKDSKTLIRARVAFRGGQAGDVDFKGSAIQWNGTWEKWRTPPTRFAVIYVSAAPAPVNTANRMVTIVAPAEAAAGRKVTVAVAASTDATDGEQIGFLHADYSNDDGKTWTKFCYAEQSGARFTREISFPVGAKGVKTLIRVRVAFRGGKAGDVDFKGGAIQWGDTWEKWRAPPTKFAIIYVTGR